MQLYFLMWKNRSMKANFVTHSPNWFDGIKKDQKRENQMAQIKKMLSCMIVLWESLFFGEEMNRRVRKQVETGGAF